MTKMATASVLAATTLVIACWMSAKSAAAAQGIAVQTVVSPEPGEDLASPCQYELTLFDPSRKVRTVWVIFDRGRDMLRYYGDPDVQAFAQRNDIGLVLAFNCSAQSEASHGDINVNPSRGLGRALLTALSQFGRATNHTELSSAGLILQGVSGAGVLVARFPEYVPDRVVAVVTTQPGQFDPVGIDTVNLSPRSASVPQLIIIGSADAITGTQRPYDYFRRHFDQAAPWTFVVQNETPHCCTINAKALVLKWLDAIVVQRVRPGSGLYGYIESEPSRTTDCPPPFPPAVPLWCRATIDIWGGSNWSVKAASTGEPRNARKGLFPAGWLPTRAFAKAWLAFVTAPSHPLTSLP